MMRGVLSNWFGFIFSALASFFLSPFIVRHLGDVGYGVWVLTGSLTGYLTLLDLGVRGAVTRYVAKFHANGSYKESTRVVSSALGIFTACGALAIVVGVALALGVVDQFRIPDGYRASAKAVIVIASGTVAVSLVGGVFGGIVVGLERFDLSNAVEIGATALRTTAILTILSQGGGLVSLALINLACAVVAGIVYAYVSFALYPGLRVDYRSWDPRYLRLILSFSAYSFLLQLGGVLVFYSDAVVIAALLPISQVTHFTIAGNLIAYCRELLSGVSTTTLPRASSLEAAGHLPELQRVVLGGNRLSMLVALPIVITFMLRGETFVGLWMGQEYAMPAGRVLFILSLYVAVAAGNQAASSAVLGIGKHKGLVPVIWAEALVNLGLSVLLGWRMGIEGVAWATTLPRMVTSLLVLPRYICGAFGLDLRQYALSSWVRPGLAVMPFAALTLATESSLETKSLAAFFTQVAVALVLSGPGFWYWGLTPQERDQYYNGVLKPSIRSLLKV